MWNCVDLANERGVSVNWNLILSWVSFSETRNDIAHKTLCYASFPCCDTLYINQFYILWWCYCSRILLAYSYILFLWISTTTWTFEHSVFHNSVLQHNWFRLGNMMTCLCHSKHDLPGRRATEQCAQFFAVVSVLLSSTVTLHKVCALVMCSGHHPDGLGAEMSPRIREITGQNAFDEGLYKKLVLFRLLQQVQAVLISAWTILSID